MTVVGVASLHTVVVWPGRMSADTLTQISLVRSGTYNDWHAALLLILWRPFWMLGVGPGWVTWASTVVFLGGLYALLRSGWARWAAVSLTVVVAAYPPVLGHIGYLGRDQWFMALLLAALGAMVRLAGSVDPSVRRRWLAITLISVWLMVASRQNALPVAGVLFLGILSSCGPWRGLGRFDRQQGASGRSMGGRAVRTGVALAMLLVLMASQGVVKVVFDVKPAHPEQATYLYDLAALSVRERQVLFSPGVYPQQDLATLDKNFSPTVVNTLLFGENPPLPFPVPPDQVGTLRNDWLKAVTSHPRGYLIIRWELWKTQIAWTGATEWIYHPFVDPNPWGYSIAHPSLDEPLQDYLRASASDPGLHGGPLYEIWLYFVATLLGLLYLRHRSALRQLLGWMCLASLLYQATIFVGAMGIGYRLTYPSVVLAIALIVVALKDVISFSEGAGRIATHGSLTAAPSPSARRIAGGRRSREANPAHDERHRAAIDAAPSGASTPTGASHELPPDRSRR